MTIDLHYYTIAEASALIEARKLSPVDLVNAALDRIDKIDLQLCSFVTVTADRALEEARAAEAALMRGHAGSRLHGIPYGLKDVFDTAGVRTMAQSRLLEDNIPPEDCDAQKRLRRCGAVLLGKNTTWEFTHGGPSWDGPGLPTRNPWNLDNSPSASSSGSAAAVAAGIVPISMGTDTGGSIREPAGACGIAGMKPTYGRVSRRGVIPNCFSHDHAGPLGRTVEDVAILMNVVAGYDPDDPSSADVPVPDYTSSLKKGVQGLTLGVPGKWLEYDLPPTLATKSAFETSIKVFESLGATIRNVDLPSIAEFDDSKRVIAIAELFAANAQDLRTRPDMFGASFRYRILSGGFVRAEDYINSMRMRAVLARAVQTCLKDVDLIISPTCEPAGKLEPLPHFWTFKRNSYTSSFNVSGNPALSVCNGFAQSGMPTSLQIVGRLFDEETVPRAGHAFERETKFYLERPSIGYAVPPPAAIAPSSVG